MAETAKVPTTATETIFACGHTEIHGGNLADPTFIYADLRVYRQDAGLCAVCRDPDKYLAMRAWKPSGESPLEKEADGK